MKNYGEEQHYSGKVTLVGARGFEPPTPASRTRTRTITGVNEEHNQSTEYTMIVRRFVISCWLALLRVVRWNRDKNRTFWNGTVTQIVTNMIQ